MKFGERDYREGALERFTESEILLRRQQFSGSVYLAGRAVEGMLRALIWSADIDVRRGNKSLATGHDLRELLTHVQKLGLLRQGGRDFEFATQVQSVGRRWFNDMRFAPIRFVENRWKAAGIVNKQSTMKQAAAKFYEDCSEIVKRCEELCHN